jgi:hypothetical protein
METNTPSGGVWISFARRSIGNAARMDANGNCRSSWPAAGTTFGGVETGRGLDCGAAAGGAGRGGAAAATGSGGATAVALLSSERRNRPRSNPLNFDFTMFDMNDYAIPVFCIKNKKLSI